MKAGTVLVVTLAHDVDARPMRGIYLGTVEGAVDRSGRSFVAVDNGNEIDGWALMMETQIATSRPVDPPITMVVVKNSEANRADMDALADLIREANRDTSGFIILPAEVMNAVKLVQVQDTPDAPDAVEALRKILAQGGPLLTDARDRLTPAEVALCERLQRQ